MWGYVRAVLDLRTTVDAGTVIVMDTVGRDEMGQECILMNEALKSRMMRLPILLRARALPNQ